MKASTLGSFRSACAALGVCAFAAASLPAAVVIAPVKPAPAVPNSECLDCHEAEFKARKKGQPKEWVGVRPEFFAKGAHSSLNCVECHTSIAETPHPAKLPRVECASCHEQAVVQFKLSIHGAPRANGQPSAATCATCHGANTHELLPATHVDSPVSKLNLLATCAACHEGAQQAARLGLKNNGAIAHFRDSIHGQGLYKMGLKVAPSCNDCHGVHDIRSLKDAAAHTSKANLSATCSVCHVGVAKTFAASVHGVALREQPAKAPACMDCHEGANVSFTHYQPHANPTDGRHYPVLNKVYLFMMSLLIGVFVFFTLHTCLWVGRMTLNYFKDPVAFRAARAAAHHDPETFRRFNPFERFLHMPVRTSIMKLVTTSM